MARSSLKTSNPRSCLFAACEAEVLEAGIIIHHKRNLGLLAFRAILADDRIALFHSDPLAKVTARAPWSEFIQAHHHFVVSLRFHSNLRTSKVRTNTLKKKIDMIKAYCDQRNVFDSD
jgi:hypothetical protein